MSKQHSIAFVFALLALAIIMFVVANLIGLVQIFIWPDAANLWASIERINLLEFGISNFKALLGVSVFSIACFGLGLGVLDRLKLTNDRLILALTAFLTGEILFSFTFLTLISLTELTPRWVGGILLIGTTLGVKPLWEQFRQLLRYPLLDLDREKTLSVLIIGVTISSLFYASARLGYDAAAEYFTHAKIIAQTGQKILMYPSDGFVVSSLHPGILFSASIQLFGDQAARMLSWVNGLVILLAGWAIGREMGFSSRARLFFLTLLLTSTAFVDLLGDGKVELISTAPIAVALYWMLKSCATPTPSFFLLNGVFLGFAIISRPYNIFLVTVFTALFYLLWWWDNIRSQGWKPGLQRSYSVLWMIPTLVASGAFHLWQNHIWLNSFMAPLAYSQNLNANDWQWQFDPASLNTLRLLYPFTITFMNTPQSLGNISPLFIGSLPFLLLTHIRARLTLSETLRNFLLPALITLTLWITLFFTVVEIRYVLFIWVLLLLFGAQIIETIFNGLEKGQLAILRAMFSALLIFITLRALLISLTTYSPLDTTGQAHCDNFFLCSSLIPVNQAAAPGDRIFVLNSYRYYLRQDLFACSSQANEYHRLQMARRIGPTQFWEELYRQGFTYVIYEEHIALSRFYFGELPSTEYAPAWLTIEPVLYISNDMFVYHLRPEHPPKAPEKACQQTDDGRWQVIDFRP